MFVLNAVIGMTPSSSTLVELADVADASCADQIVQGDLTDIEV
jgi:hypothetical protein